MPKVRVDWGDEYVFVKFKDLFDTGISIKFAVERKVYKCKDCTIIGDMDNLDVNIKRCFAHRQERLKQTRLSDFI